jgi:hypothetical protein
MIVAMTDRPFRFEIAPTPDDGWPESCIDRIAGPTPG